MPIKLIYFLFFSVAASSAFAQSTVKEKIQRIKNAPGLIAFWDFRNIQLFNGREALASYYDSTALTTSIPLFLRRLTDNRYYSLRDWPYLDSPIQYDTTGPLGSGLFLDRGYVFAEAPRIYFDQTPLNINGHTSFSMIVWIKFNGQRHCIAGIWNEGTWEKYSGTRQYAMFGGLFEAPQSVLFHISATGSASYPQSQIEGSQYARDRSIEPRNVPDHEWHALGVTYNHHTGQLTSYLDGFVTQSYFTDAVANSVYAFKATQQSNPAQFQLPIFHPRAFILKFAEYNPTTEKEHWLHIDLINERATYGKVLSGNDIKSNYKVTIDVLRGAKSIFENGPIEMYVSDGDETITLPLIEYQNGDILVAQVFQKDKQGNFTRPLAGDGVATQKVISEGAPFTVGRAQGSELSKLSSGTSAWYDGIAIFNRELSSHEMKQLSFIAHPVGYIQQVKAGRQIKRKRNYDQEIEIVYRDGMPKLNIASVRMEYNNHIATTAVIGNPVNVRLKGLPFHKPNQTTEPEFVKITLLDPSGKKISEWSGRRFFQAPVRDN